MRSCRRENAIVDETDDDAEFLMSSDEEAAHPEPPAPEVILIVEKILGRKMMPDPDAKEPGTMVEMLYVKWRGLSWLWVSWEKQGDIERVDPNGRMKVKRFLTQDNATRDQKKLAQGESAQEEEEEEEEVEYFDPDCAEVHRIIECDFAPHECRVHSRAKTVRQIQESQHGCLDELKYLVKWRTLPYNECTWERFDDIRHNEAACVEVLRFWSIQTPKPAKIAKIVHPDLHQYKRLTVSPDYGASSLLGLTTGASSTNLAAAAGSKENKKVADLEMVAEASTHPSLNSDAMLEDGEEGEIAEEGEEEVAKPAPSPSPVPATATATAAVAAATETEGKDQEPSPVPATATATATAAAAVAAATETEGKDQDQEPKTPALHLRDYQLEGVNWLLWNWWHRRPCVLADEMGLGKTIQTVCFLQQLRQMEATRVPGPFLIISPLSLIAQWQSEVAMWAPDMNCVQLHGSQEARDVIAKYEFYYQPPHVDLDKKREYKRKNITKFDVLLTTYEVAMRETRTLCKFNWQVMVVDEAHRLKNSTSKLFEQLCLIPKEHCLLLTGTPMQNKTEELWSLMNFADRQKFDDQESFVKRFGDLKDAAHVGELHAVLKPYLLRRIKEDVEKSLPPKQETIVEVSLTSAQKKFYRAIYEKNTSILFKGVKQSNQPSLMNVMMELRKCCNHPYLCRGVEDLVLNEIPVELRDITQAGDNVKPGSTAAAAAASVALGALSGSATNDPALNNAICQKLINSSGKLVLLDKLLPRLFEQGHKVLIFSQMVRVLNLIEDYVRYRGYLYERLDGSLRSTLRTAAVKRFCAPAMNRFIMLLSTKAGGLGLNLTAADTVIIFDSDWNPHNDLQAQARAHRIGQTKAVMVYRLLTRKTYEMHMFHMASMKLGMDRAVLAHARNEAGGGDDDGDGGRKRDQDASLNAAEIDELLKRGAYDVFREDETEQEQFAEADIDAIMQRQSHVVSYNNEGSNVAKSLGSFSKASFVSADEKEDVDINDPDFWKKAIGLEDKSPSLGLVANYGTVGGLQLSDEQLMELANLPMQRKRKQTVYYGSSEHMLATQDGKRIVGDREELSSSSEEEEDDGEKKDKKDKDNFWGAHARDRLVRGIVFYGINSRYLRLRRECGAAHRQLSDLQTMAEGYMLQCGMCVLETTGNVPFKNDTALLKEQLEKAEALKMFLESGEEIGEGAIPAILTDGRFVSKLKSGLARKVLNKMDTIVRVTAMVIGACKKAFIAKRTKDIESHGGFADPELLEAEAQVAAKDPDVLFCSLSVEEIADQIPLGDIRPQWTRMCSWWDHQCDKHLVLSCFKFGFGKYDMTLEAENSADYVFKGKLIAFAVEEAERVAEGEAAGEEEGEAAGEECEGEKALIEGTEGVIAKPVAAEVAPPAPKAAPRDIEEGEELEDGDEPEEPEPEPEPEEDNDEGDGDDDEEGGKGTGTGGKRGCPRRDPLTMLPDVRSLNRLLGWLVTSDAARVTRKQLSDGKKKRHRRSKEEMEAARREAAQHSEAGLTGLVERHRTPRVIDEAWLLSSLRDVADPRALGFVFADNGLLLQRCERMVRPPGVLPYSPHTLPVEVDAMLLPGSTVAMPAPESLTPTAVTVESKTSGDEDDDGGVNAAEQEKASAARAAEEAKMKQFEQQSSDLASQQKELGLSDEEVTRLSAALIRYGAPADAVPLRPLPGLEHVDGIAQLETGDAPPLYNWEAFRQLADITAPEHDASFLRTYYHSHFVPFMYAMGKHGISPTCTKSAAASAAAAGRGFRGNRLIPHPFRPPAEHCHAARGLCQVFAARQQMLSAIRWVFSSPVGAARLDWFLRSPYGRDVRGVPIWWCPWIHDLGAMRSCLHFGFLNVEMMCLDRRPDAPAVAAGGLGSATADAGANATADADAGAGAGGGVLLPFHRETVSGFVRNVFLRGCGVNSPVFSAADFRGDASAANAWCNAASSLFPEYSGLELRCARVLEAVTHPGTMPAQGESLVRALQVDASLFLEAFRSAGMHFLPASVLSVVPFPGSAADTQRDADDINEPVVKRMKMESGAPASISPPALEEDPVERREDYQETSGPASSSEALRLSAADLARVYKCRHATDASVHPSFTLRKLLKVT